MRKLWISFSSAWTVAGVTALLAVGQAQASVIDAPHNASHNVACGTCHAYSLWWQYSPTAPFASNYGAVTDAVCDTCHGPGGQEFQKSGHSAASMADAHNTDLGEWSTKCVDCHNPHLQAQLDWLLASPPVFGNGSMGGGLYLAEGKVTAITDNGNGTTTITFDNATAKAPWEDTLRWSSKSGIGRGLLLSLGYKRGEQTYEIVDASGAVTPLPTYGGQGTITVQNGGDAIPTNYAGTEFGIIYGQLIKSKINTPNSGAKLVKFFDSQNNGYVDSSSSAPKAICQVCHTKTTYWRNDGTLTTHNDGSNCTSCHSTSSGFKPNFPNHNDFIAKLTACVSCHTQDKVAEGIHHFNCTACHAASGPPALRSPAANTPFRTTPSAWPTGSTPPNVGDCGQCHGSDYFMYHQKRDDHTGQVDKAVPNCTSACHYHDKTSPVADIHKGKCELCHGMTPNADGSLGQKISLAAQYGPGDCTNCHQTVATDPLNHPKAFDHTGQVDREPSCTNVSGCHPGNTVYQVHPRMCVTCHEPTYFGLQKTFAKAIAIQSGTCVACHSQTANDGHNTPVPAP